MRFRQAALPILLLLASGASIAIGPSDPGTVDEPSCKVTLTQARESHGARYSTRCNFEQRIIRVRSSTRIFDLDTEPRLSGKVDDGDGIRCSVPEVSDVARCEGSAGSGVRVGGYLETKGFQCEVSTRFRITGGPDCPPGMACPEIAYLVRTKPMRPSTCGDG